MSLFRPKYRPMVKEPKTGKIVKGGLVEAETWWCDFTYSGKRIRESTGQKLKTLAVEYEKQRRRELERAVAGLFSTEPARKRIQTVAEVLAAYRDAYLINHDREKSRAVVLERGAHLDRLLGDVLISDMNAGRALAYMQQRKEEGVGNRTINMELSVLSRALGHTWRVLWPKLSKLTENRDAGRALESHEEAAVLEAAVRNRSPLIEPFLMVLTWTGMRADEARTLRWAQVEFDSGQNGRITVGRAKTAAGTGRMIPMSGPLRMALERHAAWYAQRFGPVRAEWYVFPLSNRTRPTDPERPVSSLKTAWSTVRSEAAVMCRLHDLRHSFCTKLAEAGVAESVMLDMMGHVSPAMLKRYSHIRARAREEAIATLETRELSKLDGKESPKVSRKTPSRSLVTH
jgi:integrase